MKAICLPRGNRSSFCAFCSSRLTFCAVELRRVNMDRVSKVLCVCWWDCRKDRWGKWENLCLWSVSRAARNETWHVDDNCFGTQRCAILSLPALEPLVFPWCAHLYMLFEWVCCSQLPSVVWKFFSNKPKLVQTLRKQIHKVSGLEELWEFQLLVFQWFDDDDEAVCRFPRDNLQPVIGSTA